MGFGGWLGLFLFPQSCPKSKQWVFAGISHVREHQIPECEHIEVCTQNFHIYTLTPLVKLGVVFKSPYSSQQGNNEK